MLAENVSHSCLFAFTITLQRKLYTLDPAMQYDVAIGEAISKLRSIGKVTCVAELTKASNIHLHGFIVFKDAQFKVRLMFNNLFRKSKIIGFTCLKQVEDENGWLEYVSKELDDTRNLISRPPIIIDELNKFQNIKNDITKCFLIGHNFT